MTLSLPGLFGIAWFLSEATVFLRDLQAGAGERRDRGSRLLIVAGVCIAITVAITCAKMHLLPLPGERLNWIIAGGMMLLGGIALRQWAVWWLGAQFRTQVTLLEGHRLIDTGPYRRVRHPSYTGALVSALGFGLILGDAASVLAMGLILWAALAYRIRIEERALAEHFGAAWSDYAARTGALLPRLR